MGPEPVGEKNWKEKGDRKIITFSLSRAVVENKYWPAKASQEQLRLAITLACVAVLSRALASWAVFGCRAVGLSLGWRRGKSCPRETDAGYEGRCRRGWGKE